MMSYGSFCVRSIKESLFVGLSSFEDEDAGTTSPSPSLVDGGVS